MTTETVRLLVYYDGIVEHGLYGIQYNKPPCKSFRISTGTPYQELVERLYTVLQIEVHRYILRLMWRSPTLHQKYVLHPIEGDEDVEEMFSFPLKYPEYRYVELYVSKEDAPDPINDEHRSPLQCSSHPMQQELGSSVEFAMFHRVISAVQPTARVTTDFTTDQLGLASDNSAEDDDYWPEHEDSDEERADDDDTIEDDIVNMVGCSSAHVTSNLENVPTEVLPDHALPHHQVPEFYHHLNLDEEGCSSTPESLPLDSQFWDSTMTEFSKGLLFTSKHDLKRAYDMYHIKKHRAYSVVESKKAFWSLKCASSSNATQSCKWRLRATKLKKHGFFEITRYEGPHSCVFSHVGRDNKHISSKVISHAVRHIVEKDPTVNIQAIIATVAEHFHYTVSYYKAWSGKQKALIDVYGEWDPSFAKLPKYMLALQNANPGTVVCWDFYAGWNSDVRVLNYVFWSFQPSIDGFRHCRPVISIDGTHLYGKYKGKMLIATSVDANNRIFPLAFAIVDEETAASWSWFLIRLRRHVVKDIVGICLISDRHPGILSAIADNRNGWAQPQAFHRYCLRHVCSNFNSRFSNVQLKRTVWKAGSEHQVRKFNFLMDRIKVLNAEAWTWLSELEPEKWTLAHDGGFRYGILTTNLSEVFNSVLKGARNVPITACVQMTFYRLVSYFNTRRAEAISYITDNPNNIFSPNVAIKLVECHAKANEHRVIRFNMQRATYEVVTKRSSGSNRGGGNVQIVSLVQRTCSCGKWKIFKYPCSHVIAVCQEVAVDATPYVDEVYTIASYMNAWGGQFNPLPHEDYWMSTFTCIPDQNRLRPKKKGKPKSTRIHNEMDESRTTRRNHCSICKEIGHSCRTCPNVNVSHVNT